MWILLALLLSSTMAKAQMESGASPFNGLGEGRVACDDIPPLHYPSAISDGSIGGTVLVKVFVDETGRIYDTELVESDLPELFIVEALKVARLSSFRPANRNGKAMRGSILMPMVFSPRDPVADTADPEPQPEPDPEPVESQASAAPVVPAAAPAETLLVAETPAPVISEETTIRILDAGFGVGVRNRELQDRGEIFGAGDRVYFWMELEGLTAGQVLTHAWIFRGRAVQEIELTMKGEHWRSWSYKTIFPGLEGAWLLELRDDAGRLLGSWSFHCE